MIKTLSPFRFSKNISHRLLKKNIKNITPINISKRTFVINGKDLYYPKYGTSWYEPGGYSISKKIQPNSTDSIIKGEDNIKKIFKDNGFPQITNTSEYMDNIEKFDSRVDYDDENIIDINTRLERWNSRED